MQGKSRTPDQPVRGARYLDLGKCFLGLQCPTTGTLLAIEDIARDGPLAPSAVPTPRKRPCSRGQTVDDHVLVFHSLNISTGFRLASATTPTTELLTAAATAEARLAEEGGTAPISAENLQILRQRRDLYGSIKNAGRAFKEKVHTFTNPQAPPFPRDVVYQKHCPRGMCTSNQGPRERQFCNDLLKAFTRCSAKEGKAADAMRQDLILAVEVHRDRTRHSDRVFFVSLALASAQSGIHPATQTFAMWVCCGDAGATLEMCRGVRWELEFKPLVVPARAPKEPIHAQTRGSVNMMLETELSQHICDAFLKDALGGKCVDQVVVRKCRYKDLSLKQVEILGVDESFACEVVQSVTVLIKEPRKPAAKNTRAHLA